MKRCFSDLDILPLYTLRALHSQALALGMLHRILTWRKGSRYLLCWLAVSILCNLTV